MKHIVVCSVVLGEVVAMQKKKKKIHQVKIISPFLLNKIIATSTTKKPRKA